MPRIGLRDFLAHWLARAGRFEDGISHYMALLMDHIRFHGPDAPDTRNVRDDLVYWLEEAGRYEEAEPLHHQQT